LPGKKHRLLVPILLLYGHQYASDEEDGNLEKKVCFTLEEATALLEMSLCTTMLDVDDSADSALRKLGDLCRQFALDESNRDFCACESRG
jgi:hypothetical protein